MTSAQRRWRRFARFGSAALVLAFAGGAPALARDPLKLPGTQYEPIAWAAIEGWADDDHEAAFETFLKSCNAILQGPPKRDGQPMAAALFKVCQRAVEANPHKPGEARAFFEKNFRPVRISPLGTPDGFVTGYYEPIVDGSRTRGDGYDFPLYRKPSSLLPGGRMVVAGAPPASEGKKKKHSPKRRFGTFYDRAAIDDGALAGRELEICWLKDPIESFFAHIQGSVRVLLDDGKLMRLNYAAANGHPYYAVGRWLIDKGIVSKDDMSMDRIREWMERNPEEGKELRRRNRSYVFFHETHLSSNEEPVGAEGISLTPGRSIAVDHRLHTYGTPFFISAYLPIEGLKPDIWFRRTMIAQDTGGAIVGPARADLYFGAGDEAATVAGRMRHYGRFVMLTPREIVPAADDEIPLPRPRPNILVAGEPPAATAEVKAEPEPVKPAPAQAEPIKAAAPALVSAEPIKRAAEAAAKPAAKVAARTPEPASPKAREPAPKADRASEKKTEKKQKAKAEGKTAATKLDAWEARVMPVIPPETTAAKSKSQSKKK
jgi:membrane-bound lytic murein transglycosylase A